MLGLKRRFFPTVLIAMRKNLLPCLSVSEPLSSVLNAWPKETKSGSMSWCWLCWRQFFFFQRLWISVFQCTRLGSSIKKKKGGGGGHGEATNEVLCPFFLYLFIYCYLLWLFCWNSFVRPNPGWDTSHPSLTRSCIAQKILAQHLHIPKRLSYGLCVFFWRFFLECILCTCNPVRYCNNSGTFHPPGKREGNQAKKKSGGLKLWYNWNTKLCCLPFAACFSVVNSTCIVLYHMLLHGSSYRSLTLCLKGPLSFELIYLRPKTFLVQHAFPQTSTLRPFAGCNAIVNGFKWQQLSFYFQSSCNPCSQNLV